MGYRGVLVPQKPVNPPQKKVRKTQKTKRVFFPQKSVKKPLATENLNQLPWLPGPFQGKPVTTGLPQLLAIQLFSTKHKTNKHHSSSYPLFFSKAKHLFQISTPTKHICKPRRQHLKTD